MIEKINRESFDRLLENLKVPQSANSDFLYAIYDTSINGINELNSDNIVLHVNGVNHVELINYCIGEYLYNIAILNDEQKKVFESSEDNIEFMASIVCDKYLSLAMFNYQNEKVMNRFLPPISNMNLYLNFMMNVLNHAPVNDPKTRLLADLLNKSISLSRCIISLLLDGYTTEAFATWRTLHECECTLILLEKYGEPLMNLYLKHMRYGYAYKKGLKTRDETDAIFAQIKEEMASHNLKSKDMKKYIEYGWLYGVKEFNELENPKLNFKDGLEISSGLNSYGGAYNLSSEIVHATPILIYSNNDYFYYVTLLSLYEAFFRLENVFTKLLAPHVNNESKAYYARMRQMYYSHLVNIYNREKSIFLSKNMKK